MTTTKHSQITCWVDGPQFHLVEDNCGRFWHVSDTPRRNEPMPGIRIKPEFAERLKGLDAEGGCPDWYPAWIDLVKEGDGQYAVFTWDLVACRVEFVANVSRWEFLRLSGYVRDPAPKEKQGIQFLYPAIFLILVAVVSSFSFGASIRIIEALKIHKQWSLPISLVLGLAFFAPWLIWKDRKERKKKQETKQAEDQSPLWRP